MKVKNTVREVVALRANSPPFQGCELSWLFSRSQLEFILRDIEIIETPPFFSTAHYHEEILPVVGLERHYGLEETERAGNLKHLVLRAAQAPRKLVKLIVSTPENVQIQRLDATGTVALQPLPLPKNGTDVLGTYSLSIGRIGIVPDIVAIRHCLEWRGDTTT